MVYHKLWTKYLDHAREGSGGFSFHSFIFYFSAKFKLQSDFKLQALAEIEMENRKYLICWLKRFISVASVAVAATGKIWKWRDAVCGVVGGDQPRQDQIDTDCKEERCWRAAGNTLSAFCLACVCSLVVSKRSEYRGHSLHHWCRMAFSCLEQIWLVVKWARCPGVALSASFEAVCWKISAGLSSVNSLCTAAHIQLLIANPLVGVAAATDQPDTIFSKPFQWKGARLAPFQ